VHKQNVTVSLSQDTLKKVKILAAQRGSSISRLLAEQVEVLVGRQDAYERAKKEALAFLDQGFDMGPHVKVSRDELHER
jgi:predicted transcriptional regulator